MRGSAGVRPAWPSTALSCSYSGVRSSRSANSQTPAPGGSRPVWTPGRPNEAPTSSEQRGDAGTVTGALAAQPRCHDVPGLGVNRDVQLAPVPLLRGLAPVAYMDFDAGAVDQDVDGPPRRGRRDSDLAEVFGPSREGRVVRDGDAEPEQRDERSQEAFCVPEREMIDRPNGQRGLDADVRVDSLASWPSASGGPPVLEGGLRDPDGQVAAFPQALVVRLPVADPVQLLRGLVLASLRVVRRRRPRPLSDTVRRPGAMHQCPSSSAQWPGLAMITVPATQSRLLP